MKKFNQIISVSVPVDMIAQQLLAAMAPDFKHRELVTEAVISTSMHANTLGHILGAISGYTGDLDFKVGDKVICEVIDRIVVITRYDSARHDSGKRADEHKKEPIGECTIQEVDPYRPYEKVLVKFTQDSFYSEGTEEVMKWVDHTTCSKIPMEAAIPQMH